MTKKKKVLPYLYLTYAGLWVRRHHAAICGRGSDRSFKLSVSKTRRTSVNSSAQVSSQTDMTIQLSLSMPRTRSKRAYCIVWLDPCVPTYPLSILYYCMAHQRDMEKAWTASTGIRAPLSP